MVPTLSVLEREFYPTKEAARLLRVPESTLRWWLEGRSARGKFFPPILRDAPTGTGLVTWGEFVEAGYLRAYRTKNVPFRELRDFIDLLRQNMQIPYPLAHEKPFISASRKLVVRLQTEAKLPDSFGLAIEAVSGQYLLGSASTSFLEQVYFSAEGVGPAVRFYPQGKDSPVVIDSARAFGSPSINGIRTDALVELIDAGEPLNQVAEDFDLPVKLVKAAAAFEWSLTAA